MSVPPRFRRVVIDPEPPGSLLDIALVADLTGNGRLDVVIGGKAGAANLFWYENPTWERHVLAIAPDLEAGGVCLDITGNGRPDIVAGMQHGGNSLYWFENPPNPRERWPMLTKGRILRRQKRKAMEALDNRTDEVSDEIEHR